MATRSLETFENAEDVLGADVGFHQTGYVVGVGPENVDALHASMADQRAVGVTTEDIDAPRWRSSGRSPTSTPFAAFAWEARGGYGDAYQTAQAFSAAARRAGVRLRQGTTVTAITAAGGRATGVRARRRQRRSTADHVVLAAGPVVGGAARRARHRPADHRAPRADRARRPRPGPRAGAGVLRPGLAAVHPARGLRGAAVRQLRPRRCSSPPTPTATRTRPTAGVRRHRGGEGRHPPARPDESVDRLHLRRLLRRHAGLQPGHLRVDARSTGSSSPPASPGTASRSPRRSGGSSPTSSSTAGAATPTSRTRTSASRGSPRATCCAAPIPTSAQARCADPVMFIGVRSPS